MERLSDGPVLCAEGYLFELERRGYLQAGAFVPEVVLEFPEVVMALHRDFLRAGSDVIEAFTYYGHREKLRLIGKEDQLEPLQHTALALAKQVATEAPGEPPLIAGNLCNTNVWSPRDGRADAVVRTMFDEQVAWAAEAGVDYLIAETFS
jgi:betaine-homocysteine S-methyltransferase